MKQQNPYNINYFHAKGGSPEPPFSRWSTPLSQFQKRALGLRFILSASSGTFEGTGGNTVDLSGLRARASLVTAGSLTMDQLNLEVWGVPLPIMNKLTVLQNGKDYGISNQVQLTAGNGDAMSLIFTGQIVSAWADFSGQPDAAFVLEAHAGYASAFKSVPPLSYKGAVDAATVAASIAAQMDPPLTLQNSGVNVQLTDVALPGDPMQQLRRLAQAADFEWAMDEIDTLAIWPRGQARNTAAVLIGPETGLVGYPSYNDKGVILTTLFNPTLRINGPVNVQSDSTPANGTWLPYNITHDLESEMPDGRWYTHVEAMSNLGLGSQGV